MGSGARFGGRACGSKGHTRAVLCVLSVLLLVTLSLATPSSYPQDEAPNSFTFTAAGDHGATGATNASLAALARSGAAFHLAIGDFSYDQIVPEAAWCDYVKSYVGPNFPFQLVAGDHEDDIKDDDDDQADIKNFVPCLPDRLNSTGVYGEQYYFDFPASAPLARFIMIAPGLQLNGEDYQYGTGRSDYIWLSNAIDDARGRAIPWVIVGMSSTCLTIGIKSCTGGSDVMGLLLAKRVDLVLQSDDHNYQRGKQLTCATESFFRPTCVADDGSDDEYDQGAGTVFVIVGTFGRSLREINASDPEAEYFVKAMGNNTVYRSDNPGVGFGFVHVNVSRTRIKAEFTLATQVTPGTPFADLFRIIASDGPQPIQTVTQTITETLTETVTRTVTTPPPAPEPGAPPPPSWTDTIGAVGGLGILVPFVAAAALTFILVLRRGRGRAP